MPTSFWSGYIVVITLVSLVALAVFKILGCYLHRCAGNDPGSV